MGALKNYLLTVLENCSDQKTGQDAVEHAIVIGALQLTYNLETDLHQIFDQRSACCDAPPQGGVCHIHEKKDAAELVLDGHLLGENPEEVNLAELLRIAQCEFKEVKTIEEEELESDWPRLRSALGKAFLKWQMMRVNEIIQWEEVPRLPSKSVPLWRQRFSRRQ